MDMYAFSDVRAMPTPAGASALVVGIREPDPMCMLIVVPVSSHAARNGIPVAVGIVQRRQAEIGRKLGEGDGPAAAGGVTTDLRGRELRIPQRHQTQRDEPPAGRAAPLLDHPVVVGTDRRERDLLVLGLQERLSRKPWKGWETERALRAVDVHVGQSRVPVVAAGTHLGERQRRQCQRLGREAGAGHDLRDRPQQVLVHPPVDDRAVAALDVARGLARAAR